jgi:hypothetical protein
MANKDGQWDLIAHVYGAGERSCCRARGAEGRQNKNNYNPTYICASSCLCVSRQGEFEIRNHGGGIECISKRSTGEIFASGWIFLLFFFDFF